MSSTLRITLSEVGQGCEQDPTPPGTFPGHGNYAFLLGCDGAPVVKAGRQMGPVAFDHGYAEIPDVDPGDYLVLIMVNPFHVSGGTFQSNMVALHQVVVCGCCETTCLRVYQTGCHQCFALNVLALQFLAAGKVVDPRVAQTAVTALPEVLRVGPPDTGDPGVLRAVEIVGKDFLATARG